MTCPLHGIPAPCYVCGAARARAAITPPPPRDDDPDPTRARAIARARTDRTTAKETQQP